jgi:3-oxoacyl-[acyl-carrier-protein] synthase-3
MVGVDRVEIAGTGSALPSLRISNGDFEKIMDTSDEWIRQRTGIGERRLSVDETTTSLACEAAKNALEMAKMDPKEVEFIVVATTSGDNVFPTVSCMVQKELGMENAAAMDLSAGCTGFIYALSVATGMIKSGQYKNCVVIASELVSRIVDWEDRSTCVLFGDGAGAMILKASDVDGVKYNYLRSDGDREQKLYMANQGAVHPWSNKQQRNSGLMQMDGPAVFNFATTAMADGLKKVSAFYPIEDIDMVIPHQANLRILKSAAKKSKISLDKFYINIERYANMSSASIPVAMDEAVRSGKIKRGDKIVMVGFGAGFTWGAALIEWTAG